MIDLPYNYHSKLIGGKYMVESPLLVKSKSFALEVIKACNEVKQKNTKVFYQISFCVQAQVLAQI